MFMQLNALAYPFRVGDLYFETLSDTTVEVVRNEFNRYDGETLTIPSEITYSEKKYHVTGIKAYTFRDCSNLSSVIIPCSVTKIGEGTFSGCSKLTSITLEDGDKTLVFDGTSNAFNGSPVETLYLGRNIGYSDDSPFTGKDKLKSITIGPLVTRIADGVFYDCNALTEITIPNNVKSIGILAFAGCRNLAKLTIENGDATLSFGSYLNCSSFGSPIKELYLGRNLSFPDSPFTTSVDSLTIGPSVTEIPAGTFKPHTKLSSIRIEEGEGVLKIKDSFERTFVKSLYLGRTTTTTAFANTYIENVTIGNKVAEIGNTFFSECRYLKELIIEDGDEPLKFSDTEEQQTFHMAAIETLYLGRNLSYDYNYSWYAYSPFKNHTNLSMLTIGSHVTEIGRQLFYGCTGLTTISIPENVTNIGQGAFYGCIGLTSATILAKISEIPGEMFWKCKNLESIAIPDGVEGIGYRAFCDCTGLASVTIPNSVNHVELKAFSGCKHLSSVTIPNSVTEIGNGVFASCSELRKIVFQDGDKTLTLPSYEPMYAAYSAFQESAAEDIYLGRNIIGNVFSGSSLKNITIGSCVTEIGVNAFTDCESLTSVVFPENVTTIGENAFSKCSGLNSVSFPKSLTVIDNGAFSGCNALTSVIIPENVQTVGFNAFYGCEKLMEIHSENPVPPLHSPKGEIVFSDNTYTNGLLYVPTESIKRYSKAPNWQLFHNILSNITLVEQIELSQNRIDAKVGECVKVIANVFPENATDKSLTWTTADENVATVDSEGLVTITGIGSTEITVSANDGSGVNASVSVNGIVTAAENISISAEGSTTLLDGETVRLTASILLETTTDKTVTWQSSDEDIASVDSNGLVIAHEKTGTATITASCGHVSSSIDITVAPTPVESIVVMPSDLNIEVGEQAQLEVTVLPENATDKSLTWVSSDPEVAAVSAEGVVSGKGSGTATISAVCASNSSIFGTCSVNIALPSGIASTESNSIRLRVSNQELIIEGSDAMVQVITADGRCVYSGFERKIKLQRGIYIVIIGKSVTKIVV